LYGKATASVYFSRVIAICQAKIAKYMRPRAGFRTKNLARRTKTEYNGSYTTGWREMWKFQEDNIMLKKMIAGILAFLLTLFPSCAELQHQNQRQSFNWKTTANAIVDAINDRDIDALEEMMCLNIKENVEDLPDKIEELIDSIDGKIVRFKWHSAGGDSESRSDGKKIIQIDRSIDFKTDGGKYDIGVVWEISNNFSPNEIGIRMITLREYDEYDHPYGVVQIRAIEGVGSWHD